VPAWWRAICAWLRSCVYRSAIDGVPWAGRLTPTRRSAGRGVQFSSSTRIPSSGPAMTSFLGRLGEVYLQRKQSTIMPMSMPPGLDETQIDSWLARAAPAVARPVTAEVLSGGRSNLTFTLTDATGRQWVLRRPPLHVGIGTGHDVLREFQIIRALAGATGVPVPTPVAGSADLDVIGAPFYLMDYVDGIILADPDAARGLNPRARLDLSESVVATLATLHSVDIDAIGLTELRRPGDLVSRQLKQWLTQLAKHDGLVAEKLRAMGRTLASRVTPAQRTSLVHGDYKLGNMVATSIGGVAAVLDWELTSIGDPLIDIGWLIASWAPADDDRPWVAIPPTTAGGFAEPSRLGELYARHSGLDVGQLDFFVAFAYWRWSCINLVTLARFASGAMGSRTIDTTAMQGQIEWQVTAAERALA
jgi:aminoglycoside phosphotransferase (APT) family kinase protein